MVETPNWLNERFLEKNLQKYYNDEKISVVSIDVKPAVPKGDNYLSNIYRVTIDYNDASTTTRNKVRKYLTSSNAIGKD